ncbi:hypothetical protein TELCIR_08561 [Teladorsagia circumcincta]|uniref:Uncharacterized protein n=1 Tax=Teladorsagia circumcincta TaxID=45464 RepID=A0A2G9UH80_TELCI|nr:hypothetical protein TELCIR_08561 [Teladorsagia circumcincta]
MALLLDLVLILASSTFSVWSQPNTWIDSNDLTQEILHITRADSKYMEEMMELHTHNGELDGANLQSRHDWLTRGSSVSTLQIRHL